MKYLGVDFGTTNTVAGIIDDSKQLKLIPLERSSDLMPSAFFIELLDGYQIFDGDSQSFFSLLDDEKSIKYFGNDALEKYQQDPLSGYFMRSIKSFLAAEITPVYQELFVKIISLILSNIKKEAEIFLNTNFDGIILGRPVNYMGANSEKANQQALRIMKKAALLSGFSDVRFVIEPMAASLVTRSIFDSSNPALVIDIGGGTTDVVLLGINADGNEKLSILKTTGRRIGGSDFDEILAIQKIGPFIGYGAKLNNGKLLPNHIVIDALSTRDIHKQKKFRESKKEIIEFINQGEDILVAFRLQQIHKKQLQHRLIESAESSKQELSSLEEITKSINFINEPFQFSLNGNEFVSICSYEIRAIQSIILNCMDKNLLEGKSSRIFITGGMSRSPAILSSVQEMIPNQTINRLPPYISIVAGLAVVARELSYSEDSYAEEFNVRGIPVTRH